jgi:hypothetical protein
MRHFLSLLPIPLSAGWSFWKAFKPDGPIRNDEL